MGLFVQLLLAVVITSMTILVSVLGIQVFQILHEFRLTVRKFNKILDNTQTLSENAARPVMAVNSFFAEVKDLVKETEDEIIDDAPDKLIVNTATSKQDKFHKRFFRRSGLPLRAS
jgi:hypothetical protein